MKAERGWGGQEGEEGRKTCMLKQRKIEIKNREITHAGGEKQANHTKYFTPILFFFIEAPQLQNGVEFTKTAERYSFTIASVQRQCWGGGFNINNNNR